MNNYEAFVNIRFNQGDIILNRDIVGQYTQNDQQALEHGICGVLSVEWLLLFCWADMSLTMVTEKLDNDITLKRQLVSKAIHYNKSCL